MPIIQPSSNAAKVSENAAHNLMFEGNPVRAILDDKGKPWFVGVDVCNVLGYADAYDAIKKHCKHPKRLQSGESPDWRVPPKGLTIINRADVYRLIMRSQLPAAERFESWVMEEVLPAIHDHGGYLSPSATEEALTNPDFIIRLATSLKEERAKSATLEFEKAQIEREKAVVEAVRMQLAEENATMKPKVETYNSRF